MDSARGSVGWAHVDPFEADREEDNQRHHQPATVQEARDEDSQRNDIAPATQEDSDSNHVAFMTSSQDGRGDGENTAEANQETARSSGSQDTIEPKKEHAGSSSEGFREKVKTAAHEAKFTLQNMRATAPAKGFNPTSVRMHVRFKGSEDDAAAGDDSGTRPSPSRTQTDFNVLWRSRDNRKGRGSIAVPHRPSLEKTDSHIHIGKQLKSIKEIFRGIFKMATTFPYWNLAFWSGWAYAWGSVLFIISATWSWVPQQYPDIEYNEGLETYGVPLTTFFGVLLYQLGATTSYLEAVNDGSFHGSAMRRLLAGHEDEEKKLADEKIHDFFAHAIPHPHKHKARKQAEEFANSVDPEAGWRTRDIRERPGSIYPIGMAPAPRRAAVDFGEAEEGESSEYMVFRYWPTWQSLRTHHAYEIGYLACSIQGVGVTLFGWTGIALLPGVFDHLGGRWGELGAYWIPQMIASLCFIIASVMFTLETQRNWWRPQPNVLGWWIGFVATLGSIGFEYVPLYAPFPRCKS